MNLVIREVIMIIISKEFFHFFKALTPQQSLVNPTNLRNLWLVISILFMLTSGHYLVKKNRWLYVLVVPCRTRAVINFVML